MAQLPASLRSSADPFQVAQPVFAAPHGYFLLAHLLQAQRKNAEVVLSQSPGQSYTSLMSICCFMLILIAMAHKFRESYGGNQVLAVFRHFPEHPPKGQPRLCHQYIAWEL